MQETGGGLTILSDGTYRESEMESVDNFLLKFAKFDFSLKTLMEIAANPSKANFDANLDYKTASKKKSLFDKNGKMIKNPVFCP